MENTANKHVAQIWQKFSRPLVETVATNFNSDFNWQGGQHKKERDACSSGTCQRRHGCPHLSLQKILLPASLGTNLSSLDCFLCCFMNMKRAQCSDQADTFFKVQVFPTTFVSATITFSTSEVWKDKNYELNGQFFEEVEKRTAPVFCHD